MHYIPSNKYPQVLLFGNGLIRTYGGDSWGGLMKKIAVREDLPRDLHCPMPLQAMLVTNDQVSRALVGFRSDFYGSVNEQLTRQLQRLLAVGFDDILTTNYSYELEAAALSKPTVTDSYLRKMNKHIQGQRAETKYLLQTYQSVPFQGVDNRIWHIHGEARKPNSMILGHYHYGALLQKMVEYVNTRGYIYEYRQKQNQPQTIRGWIDSFILGDVYILGFGMNFAEIDLWWLLNRKKREKADHGKVYFYNPGVEGFNEKEELLRIMDAETVDCGVSFPKGTEAEKSEAFSAFYELAIEDICKRVSLAKQQ